MKHLIWLILTFAFLHLFNGCGAARIPGELIRGDSEKYDVVITSGITPSDIKILSNIGLSVNGIDASGKTLIGIGGETNSNVFSDMFMMKFLKNGYNAVSMNDNPNSLQKAEIMDSLYSNGINLILIINNNLSGSTSELDWLTGGEYMKAGVNSFTIKAFRTEDKKMLFIGTGEYEKIRTASEVSDDVVKVYTKIIEDKLKNLNKK